MSRIIDIAKETNQKNTPTNPEFIAGIRLYYNEIEMMSDKKLQNNEPFKAITDLSLNTKNGMNDLENIVINKPELISQETFKHENDKIEMDSTNEHLEFTLHETLKTINEYQEPKDTSSLSHNSVLEDQYVFSTSLED